MLKLAASRAGIIEGLIGACVAKLQAEGMHRLFLDGVSSRSEGMKLHQSGKLVN